MDNIIFIIIGIIAGIGGISAFSKRDDGRRNYKRIAENLGRQKGAIERERELARRTRESIDAERADIERARELNRAAKADINREQELLRELERRAAEE